MNFIPDTPTISKIDVPYYDDVRAEDGWQGHTTGKSVESLKAEVITAIQRLGGMVQGFQKGKYVIGEKDRDGFQVHYTIEQPDGTIRRGRLDVAALPVRNDFRLKRSYDQRREKSLKMALFMLREALYGTWFLQQLSPGYAPLMPWMLVDNEKTITQLWSESVFLENLLPSGQEFVEGEIVK